MKDRQQNQIVRSAGNDPDFADGSQQASVGGAARAGSVNGCRMEPPQSPADGVPKATPQENAQAAHRCPQFQLCQRWMRARLKAGLREQDDDLTFNPGHDVCYCHGGCAERHADCAERGGKRYGVPKGWSAFGLAIDERQFRRAREGGRVFESWHVAFHGTTLHAITKILNGNWELLVPSKQNPVRRGHIQQPFQRQNAHTGAEENFDPLQIFTSPSIRYCAAQDSDGDYFYCERDEFEGRYFIVALQAMQAPDSYGIGQPTTVGPEEEIPEVDPLFDSTELEYYTRDRPSVKVRCR